jgi:oxygen-independent coproporphyrinogen-3 oxidase
LGRIHTAAEGIEAFQAIRRAGFDNAGLDLIYGLPGQSLASWRASLEQALALAPEHLSLYALSVEAGTPLAEWIAQGKIPAPDPDLAAEMYELGQETLAAAGYLHYEISNWARGPAFQCRHNLVYWRNHPYLGIGAGAHSWVAGRRWANASPPAEYTDRLLRGESPIAAEEKISPDLEVGETMIMGLRLVAEGVGYRRFRERFGVDLRQRFAPELAELEAAGLIEVGDGRVRLSPRGRLLGNQVFLHFLPA